ncbi:MAG: PQQ-dependent dehydrogenase, methanol/ethanol family [Candidatus Rokuibacteriota bacterium]
MRVTRRSTFILVLLVLLAGLGGGVNAQDGVKWTPVTDDRLLNAEKDPGNWLTYYRSLDGWRYSPLDQVRTRNVKRLAPRWIFSLGETGDQESHPVVNDGVMIVTSSNIPHVTVYALDAKTGKVLWKWTRKMPDDLTAFARIHPHNRGVALYGDKVYVGTLDSKLVALDARTGKELWVSPVGDYKDGYFVNAVPFVAKGTVITYPSGPGEMGIRGFAEAFDAETGKSLWKTYFVPGPGEKGFDTWEGDSWERGGGPVWLTPTYDKETDTVYFGTGNPSPFIDVVRKGDNLFTSTLVAVDRATGKYKWYYQYLPNDAWDFDTMNEHTVVKIKRDGEEIPALISAQKTGYLYAFDKNEGKLLYATPITNHIDIFNGVDLATGRIKENPGKRPKMGGEQLLLCPSLFGGRNWGPSAYSPRTGLVYIPTNDTCMKYGYVKEIKWTRGLAYVGITWSLVVPGDNAGALRAFDVNTGRKVWEVPNKAPLSLSGVLATAGDLVFFQRPEGQFTALDAKTGAVLSEFNLGMPASAAPITYTVDGKQYIAVVVGGKTRARGWFAPEPKLAHMNNVNFGGMLVVFGLPD